MVNWLYALYAAIGFLLLLVVVSGILYVWFVFTNNMLKRRYKVENDIGRKSGKEYPRPFATRELPVEETTRRNGVVGSMPTRGLLQEVADSIIGEHEQESTEVSRSFRNAPIRDEQEFKISFYKK